MASFRPASFGAGMERGMRMMSYMDQRDRQAEQFEMSKQLHEQQVDINDLNMTLKKHQLESLKDKQFRDRMRHSLNGTLNFMRNAQEGGEEYLRSIAQNPELAQSVNQQLKFVGDWFVNRGVKDGRPREFAGVVPVDENKFMMRVGVPNENGEMEVKPYTDRRSSDEDDPVSTFTIEEFMQDAIKLKALADMTESALISMGDEGAMERASSRRAREDQQRHDLEMRRTGGGRAQQGDIQLMNYLIDNGVAGNHDEAFRLAKTMKTDPTKAVVDIAQSMQKLDADNPMTDPRDFESYVKDAEKVVQGIYDRYQGGGQRGDAGPGGAAGGMAVGSASSSGGMGSAGDALEKPAEPKTREEFEALPSGTWYISPANGRKYRKP